MQGNLQAGRNSTDLSGAHLPNALPGVRAVGGLVVTFSYQRTPVAPGNGDDGGDYQTRLVVSKRPKGERYTVARKFITEERAAQEFPAEYAAFVSNAELPTKGTPLSELPGITQAQISILSINGFRSIEDLLSVSEDAAIQAGYEVGRTYRRAKRWLEARDGAKDVIDLAEVEARFERQQAEAKRQSEASAEYIKKLEAQIAALSGAQTMAMARPASQRAEAPIMVTAPNDGPDIDFMPNPLAEGSDDDTGDDLGMAEPDILDNDPLAD